MDKRYQVFVSSTYDDLREERSAVSHALLRVGCFPAGMELFPAADDDQWTAIKRVIDDSDYYIVIIGGRYGSISPDGLSYTEKEYRYAVERGVPVIGFLHEAPGTISLDKSERDPERQRQLQAFRDLIQQKMIAWWRTPDGLAREVIASLMPLTRDRPRIGWIRADQGVDEREVLGLRRRIDALQAELETRGGEDAAVQDFESGDDRVSLDYTYYTSLAVNVTDSTSQEGSVTISWDHIFKQVAVELPAADETVKEALHRLGHEHFSALAKSQGRVCVAAYTGDQELRMIRIQLLALGLVRLTYSGNQTNWYLTSRGEQHLVRALARRRQPDDGRPT